MRNSKISFGHNTVIKFSNLLTSSSKNDIPKNVMLNQQEILRSPIASDFYACTMGFFCKRELKIQKITGLPLFLRLGSLSQCNYLEGKN
ncbi:MAG: hypothetical protein ABIO82_02710 [Ginsengibacter sp.]